MTGEPMSRMSGGPVSDMTAAPVSKMTAAPVSEATGRTQLTLQKAQVLANEQVAPDVYLMELTAPTCCAELLPGQFVNIRIPQNPTEILRLPFSVFGTIPELGAIEVLYQVLGQGTRVMSHLSMGQSCDLIGPIGRGFSAPANCRKALLVSGGLGAAALTMLAGALHDAGIATDIVMGAPTAARLVGRERLESCGQVSVATDDGSEGLHGFCTQLSQEMLQTGVYDYVATCGPGPMERIVASQAASAGVYCEVSLERLMACGIGVCLSCVVDTTQGRKRVCVDGPVFDASEVMWDD